MKKSLLPFYDRQVLGRPVVILLLVVLVTSFFAWYIQNFKLDVSSDSLVLEGDEDLRYYRSINARYGADDYLIVTYTPKQELFAAETVDDIEKLSNSLAKIERDRQAQIAKQKAEEEAKRKRLDALIGGVSNSSGTETGGEGNDNVAGDKGKINGDPNADGYYGNGGSGGGGGARGGGSGGGRLSLSLLGY